jgi:hypothetical protein
MALENGRGLEKSGDKVTAGEKNTYLTIIGILFIFLFPPKIM